MIVEDGKSDAETQELPMVSLRDLSPLYEAFSEEDDPDGNPIFLYSSFGFITDDFTAYFGQSTLRKYALTVEEVGKRLELLPDDDVYPKVPTTPVTTFSGPVNNKIFLKRPKLNMAFKGTGLSPKLLLQEAEIMEILLCNPHPNIIRYHGCLTRRGRIVSLVLDRYDMTLEQKLDRNMIPDLDVDSFMVQITSAIGHLHSLGLAHNDLNPMNIMLDDDNQMILIDFGSCQPFGSALITAGTFGWIDEQFFSSAKEHDMIALNKLTSWLHSMKERGRDERKNQD